MERKTKHRILGILVIAAFGIIMLPFFEGGRSPIPDATIVKAPPFPGPSSAQAALNPPITLAQTGSSAYNQQPDDTISTNSPTAINAQAQTINPPQIQTAAPPQEQSNIKNAATTAETNPAAIDDKKITQVDTKETEQEKNVVSEKNQTTTETVKEPVAAKQDQDMELDTGTEEENDEITPQPKQSNVTDKTNVTKNKTINKIVKPIAAKVSVSAAKHTVKKVLAVKKPFVPQIKPFVPEGKSVAIVDAPIDVNGLAKLRNAAWVIQIGSFKDKGNALRLVNQLRAKGYRAFIQQVSSDFGNGTRVFIGPEPKQNTARALATQLESNMHIRGIVISYKPLAL